MKICPNCEYVRQPDDDSHGHVPLTECPKCRAIYEKAEKAAKIKQDNVVRVESGPIRKAGLRLTSNKTINYTIFILMIVLSVYAGAYLFGEKEIDKIAVPPKSTTFPEKRPAPPVEVANNQVQFSQADKFNEKTPLPYSEQTTRPSDQQSITDLVRRIKPSVVLIQTEKEVGKGLGTGFFINHGGDVLTNHHVMVGSKSARIKTADGNVYSVKAVIAEDKSNDLAMISVGIPPGEVQPLTVTSKYPEEGERIIVIGNPSGLEGTVSDGIVSAIRGDRRIQITAPISRGSSGGPVINMKGEVVCVVSSARIDVVQRAGNIAQNLNFCIPGEKVANLQPGASYALARMEPTRKIYCYMEDNGTVVITDNPQKVTSYTLISRPDGTLDRAEYNQWVLNRMGLENSPEYFEPATAAQKSVDKDRDELFRRTFPGKTRSSGMTIEEQSFWNDRINQLHRERYNGAVAWKNRAVMRYQYMMSVFDRYQAVHQ